MDDNDRVDELVATARQHAFGVSIDKMQVWRAYVALESAILDLKLRYKLEGLEPPPKLRRGKSVDISTARSMIEQIDPFLKDKKKLLYDLRACRDVFKAIVASYDRRSTMS